jgi:hypothetical protein
MTDMKKAFATIGLEPNLEYLKKLNKYSLTAEIDKLKMEIEFAEEDKKGGKEIRWCNGKHMILNNDDCSSPCFGRGCINWDGKKCVKT